MKGLWKYGLNKVDDYDKFSTVYKKLIRKYQSYKWTS